MHYSTICSKKIHALFLKLLMLKNLKFSGVASLVPFKWPCIPTGFKWHMSIRSPLLATVLFITYVICCIDYSESPCHFDISKMQTFLRKSTSE